jgi:hypothetical protein
MAAAAARTSVPAVTPMRLGENTLARPRATAVNYQGDAR